MSTTPYLARYLHGYYTEVTTTLTSLGGKVYENAILFYDARCVAHEIIQRVQQNIHLIEPRLKEVGYHFSSRDVYDPAHFSELTALQETYGPLPFILEAFLRHIGPVDWIGHHPLLTIGPESEQRVDLFGDALCIWLNLSSLNYIQDMIDEETFDEHDIPLTTYEISPDSAMKSGTSGDVVMFPYPSATFDTPIGNGVTTTSFYPSITEYLRTSMKYGGFAGLKSYEPLPEKTRILIEYLTKDCLPF